MGRILYTEAISGMFASTSIPLPILKLMDAFCVF